jgi:hypothetical protein
MNYTFQEAHEMAMTMLYSIATTASQNTHRLLYHTISYCIRNAPKSLYGFEGLTGDNLCRAVARMSPTPGWYTPITCDERLHNFINGRTVLLEMLMIIALVSVCLFKFERFISR